MITKLKSVNVCILIFLLTIVFATNLNYGQTAPTELTVRTDKTSYTYREMVTIEGNLTANGTQVDSLIGIQVSDSNNCTLLTRTITLGSPPTTNVTVLDAITCDESGNPKNLFVKNENANINVTIKNNGSNPEEILITICAYDSDFTPLMPAVNFLQTTILPKTIVQFKPTIHLESWVSTGPATFYINVFSDWPRNKGHPYCPEKIVTFTIQSEGCCTKYYENNTGNSYSLKFRLPPNAPVGIYEVSASAYSQGEVNYATTTFSRSYQVLGDINFDGVVNILDLVMITTSYGARSGSLLWKPHLDINPDGAINIQDIVVAASNYGITYETKTTKKLQEKLATEVAKIKGEHEMMVQRENKNVQQLETGIDLYTDYPEPFNGKGLNEPSDVLWPWKEVVIYACVKYRNWPEQGKDVSFQLIDPHGVTRGIFQNRTDGNGLTSISFQLPHEDLEYYFGTWTVIGTVDIAGTVYNDTLIFKYDYRMRIWCDKTATDEHAYKVQEMVTLTIEYGTFSMQTFPAVFLITAFDADGISFAYIWIETIVGGAQFDVYANNTLILNMYIPNFVKAGEATLHITALNNLMDSETLCPQCILTILIIQ